MCICYCLPAGENSPGWTRRTRSCLGNCRAFCPSLWGPDIPGKSPKPIRRVGVCPGTCALSLRGRSCSGGLSNCTCHDSTQLAPHSKGLGQSVKPCSLSALTGGQILALETRSPWSPGAESGTEVWSRASFQPDTTLMKYPSLLSQTLPESHRVFLRPDWWGEPQGYVLKIVSF